MTMKLLYKLEAVCFFVSEQTYKFSRESNNYFPHCDKPSVVTQIRYVTTGNKSAEIGLFDI